MVVQAWGAFLVLAAMLPPGAQAFEVSDCEAGSATGMAPEAREWCCATAGVACNSSFDCDAGRDRWKMDWSAGKMRWCCKSRGIGCEQRAPFDCRGAANRSAAWPEPRRAWCCEKKGVACQLPFDCAAGRGSWQTGWSPGKKAWCCRHRRVACEDQYRFVKHRGFITNGGNTTVDMVTLRAARERCALEPTCRGFTVKGDPVDDGRKVVEVYFKDKWELQDSNLQVFTSFRKKKIALAAAAPRSEEEDEGVLARMARAAMAFWAWAGLDRYLIQAVPSTETRGETGAPEDPWSGAGTPWLVAAACCLWSLPLCVCMFGAYKMRRRRAGKYDELERVPMVEKQADAPGSQAQLIPLVGRRVEGPLTGKSWLDYTGPDTFVSAVAASKPSNKIPPPAPADCCPADETKVLHDDVIDSIRGPCPGSGAAFLA